MSVNRDKLVYVRCEGLNPEEIASLEEFLKAQEGVENVYYRVRKIDASSAKQIIHAASELAIAFAKGHLAGLESAVVNTAVACMVRKWLKNRHTENANISIAIIYGPNKEVLSRVKKSPEPKAK